MITLAGKVFIMLVDCIFVLKQNKNDVINVGDRLKYSTFSNTRFWPVHTGSVCLVFA